MLSRVERDERVGDEEGDEGARGAGAGLDDAVFRGGHVDVDATRSIGANDRARAGMWSSEGVGTNGARSNAADRRRDGRRNSVVFTG